MELILDDLDVPSINRKYNYNPKIGRFFVDGQYKAFKKLLVDNLTGSAAAEPPYYVAVFWHTYHDIDNSIKVILDALQESGIIQNDRDILQLSITKIPIKRGRPNRLKITVGQLVNINHQEGAE